MDQGSRHMEAPSQQPEHDQNGKHRPEHVAFPQGATTWPVGLRVLLHD
jgi:hypothetical protein